MSYTVRNARRAKGHFADTPQWQIQRDTERKPVFWKGWDNQSDRTGFSTVNVFFSFCEINNIHFEWADKYGEPGYNTDKGVLICDWNDVPKALGERLEAQGYATEYDDEWYVSSESSPAKAWRTQPDGHGWESSLLMFDGGYLTRDDAESDPNSWIEQCSNEPGRPLPSWFDESALEEQGFKAQDGENETGFHPGQTDDPHAIGKALQAAGHDYVLQVTNRGQFDVRWRVWVKKPDVDDSNTTTDEEHVS